MAVTPTPTAPRPWDLPIPDALRALAVATDRLLATVDSMSMPDFQGPSALPGWTRAHVLAHLALNAKGLTAALTTLAAGHPTTIYASEAARDRDIARLAAEAPARIADRLAVGSAMLSAQFGGGPTSIEALEAVGAVGTSAVEAHRNADRSNPAPTGSERAPTGSERAPTAPPTSTDPADTSSSPRYRPFSAANEGAAEAIADRARNWAAAGTFERTPGGRMVRASEVPFMRWREVEIHHADLGLDYGPADWPDEFAQFLYAGAAYDRDGELTMTLSANDGPTFELGRLPGSHRGGIDGDGAVVAGRTADLAWWLVGRGSGRGLSVAGGRLPVLGPWVRRSAEPEPGAPLHPRGGGG